MGFGTWNWTKLRPTSQPLALHLAQTTISDLPCARILPTPPDQAIEGLPRLWTVADDILITDEGDTSQEAVRDHDKNMLTLLARCREKGVKLNKEKFKMRMSVGHSVTKKWPKARPIQEISRPSDVKGVQRIVGLANYLTRFLENLANICEPLRQLTHKDLEC